MIARGMGALAGVVCAMVPLVGVAQASAATVGQPGRARSHMTLAQAPAGLQAAVRRTLGVSGSSSGSPSQQAEVSPVAGYGFGYSVAVSGPVAVVGAPERASGTGGAYVFVRSGAGWVQQAELKASDAAAGDHFGESVAIAGSTAVIGAPYHNSATGAAYVFVQSGSSWSQQAELAASDDAAGDDFGASVAISGSTAVIGAAHHNSGTGAAYEFLRSGTSWSQRAELAGSDVAAGDDFGSSVAIYGTTAVIGAPGRNSGTGAAYLFVGSSQAAELTASDAATGDAFGSSVAINGSTAVIGAPGKNVSAGTAYAFVLSAGAWSQQAKLTESNGAAGDDFSSSVALYQSTAFIGDSGQSSETGAVYGFVQSGSAWSQQYELTAAVAELFGYSVTMSGSTAVIGAYGALSETGKTGAAYVYVRSGSTWSQQAELTASDAAAGDGFGWSVAMSGSTAVIGAPDRNASTGAAYVFVRSGSSWLQQAELTASDGAASDHFGASVAIAGSTAVVGAYASDSNAGAAYVFVRSGSSWSQQAELTASDGAANDHFGGSVAVYGSTTVIGAPNHISQTVAAYVFVRSGGAWLQQAELTAADGAAGDGFGAPVAMYGTTVVIGAIYRNRARGAAYVFVQSGGAWSQQAELTASDAVVDDYFGYSAAIYGSTVVIGMPYHNSDKGAAYVFAQSGSSWSQQAELTASDANSFDWFGQSVALYGTTAVIGAPGKNSGTGAGYTFGNV